MLSCLLIKALICLAEGKEVGMCADIIAKLKAMPSGSWASTMLYLQESPLLGCVQHLFIYLLRTLQSHPMPFPGETQDDEKTENGFSGTTYNLFAAQLAFETTQRRPQFCSRGNRTESSVTAAIHQNHCRESFITGSIHCSIKKVVGLWGNTVEQVIQSVE